MLLTVAGVACCIVSSSFHVTLPSPHTANKAMLSLQIKGNFLIKFEIGAGQCRLLHPADESLRPLREKALPPMELLRRLLHAQLCCYLHADLARPRFRSPRGPGLPCDL